MDVAPISGRLFSAGLGIGTAIGLGSLMSGTWFGVAPGDPLTIAAVMGAIGLTAMLASLAPLRHAVQVNPAHTTRSRTLSAPHISRYPIYCVDT